MSQLPIRVLHCGKDEPLPEQTQLRAGPLSMIFEAGDLRYIRFGDHEILRRVYVAVRDHNWDTILLQLSNVQVEHDSDAFRITYDVKNKSADVDFFWQGTITGDKMGPSPSRWTERHFPPSVATASASVCCTRWAVLVSLAVLRR